MAIETSKPRHPIVCVTLKIQIDSEKQKKINLSTDVLDAILP